MGVVHLAHDSLLERKVALKTYTPPQGVSKEAFHEFRERFLREARAAARLSHPGIVTLFDVDEDRETGQLFLAMEWVPGRSLRRVLDEEHPLEVHRVFAMARVLGDALHVAHAAGIIHRDVKPANILIRDSDGAVKLADFGVAHLVGSELTKSNASVGSPAYMSPEQVLGRSVDGRSDLFSLGIVLYEAFAGARPFAATESVALAHSIAYEKQASLSTHRPDLMAGLDAFFERALQKNPVDRFEDAKRFRLALEEVESMACETQRIEVPVPSRPVTPRRSPTPFFLRRWVLASIAALLMATGLLLRPGAADPAVSGSRTPAPASLAYLEVDGRSLVPEGELTLLLNGEEIYSRALSRPKAKNVLRRVVHRPTETWGTRLDIPAGRHEIIARIVPEGRISGYQKAITAVLKPGATRSLHIMAGSVRREVISLNLE